MTPATCLALALWAMVGTGLVLIAVQLVSVARHLRQPVAAPGACPGVSILKPLCGVDDDLRANLESFARLDYPGYEVLLGVRDTADPAWPVAQALVARHPAIFRAVVQRGEPGLNPKVNQLITLAAASRHPLVVVSDSNVRVEAGYLREIAALLCTPGVGIVTSPVAGCGEEQLGSRMDNLHLTGWVATGMIAASRVAGAGIVVGKSMALWRRDLARLAGFESVRDVLGEDFVLGRRVEQELGLRVAVTRTAVINLSRHRSVRDFFSRYQRWSVLHRQSVGVATYLGELLLNPTPMAALAALLSPTRLTLLALGATALLRTLAAATAGCLLRPRGFSWRTLLAVPAADFVLLGAWVHGLVDDHVEWRGNRLRVLPGTWLEPSAAPGRLARLRRRPAA